jgi:hypothetical protein
VIRIYIIEGIYGLNLKDCYHCTLERLAIMHCQKLATLMEWQTVALGGRCRKWQLVRPRQLPSTSTYTNALLLLKS